MDKTITAAQKQSAEMLERQRTDLLASEFFRLTTQVETLAKNLKNAQDRLEELSSPEGAKKFIDHYLEGNCVETASWPNPRRPF